MDNGSFSILGLKHDMLSNLSLMGYEKMTDIQMKSLPHILKGKDVIAKAKTGSGKTAAFGIGLVSMLNVKEFKVQALVLCPTRELAEQVGKEVRKIARSTHNVKLLLICGGVPMRPQLASLEHGAHIIVGTPGRVQAHLDKGTLRLDSLRMLVLDEADRMLEMGFYEDIEKIIASMPKKRQTLLFSATFPDTIKTLSKNFQIEPEEITVESLHAQSVIKQHFYKVPQEKKKKVLVKLLDYFQPETSLVFCNTKAACIEVAEYLNDVGFHAIDIHGDLEQRDRTEALVQFSNRSCSILVATDVAARGLDIKEINAVISYDIAFEAQVHIHRIGRTGRAGSDGLAIAICTTDESSRLDEIREYQQSAIIYEDIDSLVIKSEFEHRPPMRTLCIDAGRKQKMRPGDIMGALSKDAGIPGDSVGKIDVLERQTYVAIKRDWADKAFDELRGGKIKGRSFRVWKV